MAATSGQGISHRTHLDDAQNRLGANSEHEVRRQRSEGQPNQT